MFGYFDKNIFNTMIDRFSKIFEQDFNAKDVVIYSPSDRKKVNKKWFDGKDKDVLFDFDLEEGKVHRSAGIIPYIIENGELKFLLLKGDSSKIRKTLKWKPNYTFEMLKNAKISKSSKI